MAANGTAAHAAPAAAAASAQAGAHGHVHGPPVVHVHGDGVGHDAAHAAHEEFLVKHRGHEQLHAALLLGMLAFLVAAQVALVLWKKHHNKSFEMVTLLGMMVLPPLYALYHAYWRFLVIWIVFAAVTARYLSRPFLEKPMHVTTPRQVYWFFFLCNKVSFGLAMLGYALIVADAISGKRMGMGGFAVMLMFYGLFYGVIGRDLAVLCADKMAASLGYASSAAAGLPQRGGAGSGGGGSGGGAVCAICCDTLDSVAEEVITLPTCGHVFHSFCIRGWRIVGKRECPSCREKVELQHVFVQPWEKQSVLWSHVLDVTRYLIVWNPLIFGMATLAIRVLDH